MLSAAISGCAFTPGFADLDDPVQYLTTALNAGHERRESLWRAARRSDGSRDGELRAALMQSLPGHSGYEPGTAERRLQSLAAHAPDSDVAEVARLRLAEMKVDGQYREDAVVLQHRLDELVEIEQVTARKPKKAHEASDTDPAGR